MRKLKVGSRKSRLAMIQTEAVIKDLKNLNPDLDFEIIPLSTLGDRIQDKALTEFGGKGAFILELEEAMLRGDIDLAVHSAKDLPLDFPPGLGILGVSKREDPRDVLVTRSQEVLQNTAIIGTGSLRRKVQLIQNSDYLVKGLRGNVGTRLKKLSDGEYDGIILAAAGLKRLEADRLSEYNYSYFNTDDFIPAAGQGIIAVEGRRDKELEELIGSWSDREAFIAFETEREVVRLLDADCTTPLGVYTQTAGGRIKIAAARGQEDRLLRIQREGLIIDRFTLAREVAEGLTAEGRGSHGA